MLFLIALLLAPFQAMCAVGNPPLIIPCPPGATTTTTTTYYWTPPAIPPTSILPPPVEGHPYSPPRAVSEVTGYCWSEAGMTAHLGTFPALLVLLIVSVIAGTVLFFSHRRWPHHPDPYTIIRQEENRADREKRNDH